MALNTEIWVALIVAIIGPIIVMLFRFYYVPSGKTIKMSKSHKMALGKIKGKNSAISIKKRTVYSFMAIFIIAATLLIFYLLNINKEYPTQSYFWDGTWDTKERWKNQKVSKTLVVFTQKNKKELMGISINRNKERSILNGNIKGDTLFGRWKNQVTMKNGTFTFIRQDEFSYKGEYTIGDTTREWSGYKLK